MFTVPVRFTGLLLVYIIPSSFSHFTVDCNYCLFVHKSTFRQETLRAFAIALSVLPELPVL